MFHGRGKNLAFSAHLHFLIPAFLHLPLANGPIDEPAEIPHLELPRWTGLAGLQGATPNLPAEPNISATPSLHRPQEKHLALDMYRNLPPSLFKALNGFERGPQELGQLLLGLSQFLTKRMKLFIIHGFPPGEILKIFWIRYTTKLRLYKVM